MRQKLRRYHKESKSQHLYLKSLIYWKTFYTEFLNRIDDIMDCFRFEDIRDVAVVVKSHDFPEELVSYVTQQLMDWRELFLDVDWMKIYVEMSKKIEEQEKSRQEQEERFELLRVIALEIEMSNLSLAEFKPLNDQPEKLVVHVMGRISEETKAKTLADQLKSMPVLSRRCNTKEWCRKHYEALTSSSSSSSSSSASDDENNEENNSSIIGYCGDSSRDITSSTSSDEPDVETVDTFFSNYGL
uniref:Uncharacterized protein n=1 Tax=Caenorhabditis japonica TaxID=281687 RepID=A0A8R1HRM5_CAEJA